MSLRCLALSLLISVTGVTGVSAQTSDDPSVRWMARLIAQSFTGQQITLAVAERRLLPVLTAMNNTLPRFNDLAIRLERNQRSPRQRAQYIAQFLEKDLDNDGKVTSEELTTALEPQARMNLRSNNTGIEIEPTPEQVAQILQQLLARNLQSDTNNDGTIDFEEMRAAARQASDPYGRTANFRVLDPLVFKSLDTSGDKTISDDEFLAAIRKTYAVLDRDKNGMISSDELRPYLIGSRQF